MRPRRLFLATFCLVALITKTDPDSAHVMSRLGTVESIVDRGTYALDDSIFIGTIDKVQKDGHFYSHQPPLLSTIEAPVYWLLHLPGTRFNNRGRFVMTYAFSLLTNGLALALTVVVLARLLARANVPAAGRDVLAVLLVFGTWLLPYGIVPNNHGISALLMTAFVFLLLELERHGPSTRRVGTIGLMLGLLSAVELLPLVSFVPVTIIELWLRRDLRSRHWGAFAAALALPLLVHAAINIRITGDVIPAGFHTELFNYEGSVFDDSSLTGTLKYHAVGDAADYAWRALVVDKGFFVFAPLCLLGLIVGAVEWRWWRTHAVGTYSVLVPGIGLSLAVALLTTNNFGGEAVGFRHAVYLIPAIVVLVLPWLLNARRTIVLVVAGVSTAAMLIFAVRQPWSVLKLSNAAIGSWQEYVPIAGKIAAGTLFTP